MQRHPSDAEVLAALQAFLLEDLAPAITDRALRFRVLIAANLAAQVAAHTEAAPALRARELAGLADLLAADYADADEANRELVRRIRSSEIDLNAALAHLLDSQAALLQATDPSFDTSREIE